MSSSRHANSERSKRTPPGQHIPQWHMQLRRFSRGLVIPLLHIQRISDLRLMLFHSSSLLRCILQRAFVPSFFPMKAKSMFSYLKTPCLSNRLTALIIALGEKVQWERPNTTILCSQSPLALNHRGGRPVHERYKGTQKT